MTVFNSTEENTFHYLTFVVFQRVGIFKSDTICQFFIDALRDVKKKYPFKLVAYVIMPDHVHLIINPVGCDIEIIGKELKGISAKKILDWLKQNEYFTSLNKLKRQNAGKRNHLYSVWQREVKSVDLWSHKFILQKMNYIHLNPMRAGLCDHPAKWKWSSFNAYMPYDHMEIPIQPDRVAFWTSEEFINNAVFRPLAKL